jgi:flagella basal body P-ring formation protein FlgA
MARLFKIMIILLAMFPMWLTLVALASGVKVPGEEWRSSLNSRLLKIADQKIQITEMLPTSDLPADEYLTRSVDFDLNHINPRGISRLGLRYRDENGRLDSLVYLPVRVHVEYRVPVTNRAIRSGEILQASDFELKWMDANATGSSPVSLDAVVGAQSRSFIASESVIQASQIQPPQLVRRGDRVKVQVSMSGILVSTIGIAQEGGSFGQNIRIMNMESRRELFATVTGAQMAEVRQ